MTTLNQTEPKPSRFELGIIAGIRASGLNIKFVDMMVGQLIEKSVDKGPWIAWKPSAAILKMCLDKHHSLLQLAIEKGDNVAVTRHALALANYASRTHEILGDLPNHICGKEAIDIGSCDQGCCDRYRCAVCGKTWLEECAD